MGRFLHLIVCKLGFHDWDDQFDGTKYCMVCEKRAIG